MSTAHSEHPVDAHSAHLEPADTLAPDEPPTPAWLPALGLGLFVVGMIVFLALSNAGSGGSAAPGAASAPAVVE